MPGVADGKMQFDFLVRFAEPRDFQSHLALFGEFDGVAEQIEQNLPEPGGIAHDAGVNVLSIAQFSASSLALCPRLEQRDGILDRFRQVKIRLFQRSSCRPRFLKNPECH